MGATAPSILPLPVAPRKADRAHPDGKLYITGHDNAEVYVMEIPKMGSVLRWVGTIPVDLAGQGIAFDRSEPGVLYGIIRRTGSGSEVTVNRLP